MFPVELQMSHERDGLGGIMKHDGDERVRTFSACGGCGFEVNGWQRGKAGEIVLHKALPVEVGGERMVFRREKIELDEIDG